MEDSGLTTGGTELATLPVQADPAKVAPVSSKVLGMTRIEEHTAWPVLSRLTVTLEAGISLNRFKVRNLLRLEVGQVVESMWPETEDVPLKIGQVQLGWSEFEVVEQKLAVRVTRLA